MNAYSSVSHGSAAKIFSLEGEHPSNAQHRENVLILAHMPLARSMAQKVTTLSYDDALQEAMLGLTVAARKYNPARGAFASYAAPWITNFLQIAAIQSLPVHVPLALAKASRAANRRGESLAENDAGPKRLSNRQAIINIRAKAISMSYEDGTFMDFAEEPHFCEALEKRQQVRFLAQHLWQLSTKQRMALILRFGLGNGEIMTLEEVGGILGISREGTRQLINRGLTALRRLLEADSPKPEA